MTNRHVRADRFAAAVGEIVGDYFKSVDSAMLPSVREAVKIGRREVKELSQSLDVHHGITWERYVSGWTYRAHGSGAKAYGQVGNRNIPGLVHLIEKGHAKVGGGRVSGHEHVGPAADKTFDELRDQLVKRIEDRA